MKKIVFALALLGSLSAFAETTTGYCLTATKDTTCYQSEGTCRSHARADAEANGGKYCSGKTGSSSIYHVDAIREGISPTKDMQGNPAFACWSIIRYSCEY